MKEVERNVVNYYGMINILMSWWI